MQAETRTVRAGDIDISYMVKGEGEPLLMIMGYASTNEMWDPRVIDALAQDFQVILPNNRGVDKSTAGEKDFSLRLFAEDCANLLEALHIEKAHVLGWSMGSYIAQELTLNHPEKVDCLVLYAAACDTSMFPMSEETLARLMNMSGTEQDRWGRFLKCLFTEDYLSEHWGDVIAGFQRPIGEVNPVVLARQTKAIEEWDGVCTKLPEVTQKTLLLCGSEDVMVPPDNSRYLAQQIPHAILEIVPGAGHGLMYQEPEVFVDIVKEFLK